MCGHDAGSTVDAMSDAIEGADVMLYGVSLKYKESANVRITHEHKQLRRMNSAAAGACV
eukprot:COSAG06_NODE_119_length_23111_cov_51.658613_21_plen_59_part_00